MSASSSLFARLRAEPLVWFTLIGAAFFVIDRARARPNDDAHRIEIDDAFVEGLRTEATRRTGHAPDATETEALIDAWAREESLYREARALSLDEGDIIVRRRLVQKIELLLAAEADVAPPSDAAMEAYLAAHVDRYAAPPRTSVTLCFYARESHDDALSLARAHLATETPCDPHLSGDAFRERTDPQLAALIGTDAVASIRDAPIATWQGPFETPRGIYDVRVDARVPGGPRALVEVRSDVESAMRDDAREAAVRDREREIRAGYDLVRLGS